MVFNSYTFIGFFAVVLALHNLPICWRLKKFNLVVASLIFYAAWNPPFVALLLFSTVADWIIGNRLYAATARTSRRVILSVSLLLNLGMLGFFKYGNFALDNFLTMCELAGLHIELAKPSIILPAGISFYTFQTLSYTLDIYFKRATPSKSFLDYSLYVTFFPQLVAGPIVRSTDFLPQCEYPRRANFSEFSWGMIFLIIGLFEKIVLADSIFAPTADSVYSISGDVELGLSHAWIGTIAFAGQILCDFGGYSMCAIGAARCMGFRLPINFRSPYAAVGFSDFWRRWHISLSTWLRDYLYIPMGGNRGGKTSTYTNIVVTMFLGGLWHGAAWTFVIWGLMHGVLLCIERALKELLPHHPVWSSLPGTALLRLITFLLVCITWTVFRANSIDQAWQFVAAMIGYAPDIDTTKPQLDLPPIETALAMFAAMSLLAINWLSHNTTLEATLRKTSWWITATLLAGMLTTIATTQGSDRAFIYFQF